MSLKAGRVGVNPADVDPISGHISPEASEGYTKAQADDKFLSKSDASSTYESKTEASDVHNLLQPKTLAVPIEMLDGSKLTVETALQGLNNEKFTYADNGVLGAKNAFCIPDQSKTLSTVTATVKDGVVSFSGTNSSSSAVWFDLACKIRKGTYKFSGLDTSQSVNNIIQILPAVGGSVISQISTSDPEAVLTLADDFEGVVYLRIAGNGNTTGVKAKLMASLLTDTDDTYAPYAMTNRELTEFKIKLDNSLLLASNFSDFKNAMLNE